MQNAMQKSRFKTLFRAACLALLFGCSDRMVASKDGTEANKLLLLAAAAKRQPLTADASRELEAHIVDEFLKGATAEEQKDFRHSLDASFMSSIEMQPDAPDTPEVKQKWALLNALMDLRKARSEAARRARNPPIDMTDRIPVQVLLVGELKDTTADAMIYRRAIDATTPYLVLREQKLTAQDLYRYVRHAVRIWDSMGTTNEALQSVSVFRDSTQDFPAAEVPPGYQQILDELAATQVVEFPGIGKGRTFGVMARKSTSAAGKPRTQ